MPAETKTPLEIAGEVWALEWEEGQGDLMAYMPLFGWIGFIGICGMDAWEFAGGEQLNVELQEAHPDLVLEVERLDAASITPTLTSCAWSSMRMRQLLPSTSWRLGTPSW